MARFVIMDYDKAQAAIVAAANTSDEKSAIESVPRTQSLPNRVAVVRTAAIQEFFVLSSELLDETPTLIVREGNTVNNKTPPAEPQGLTARLASDGDDVYVVLDWLPGGPDEDLMGFLVFRDGVQISLSGTLSFVDPSSPEGLHTYDVHAMNTSQVKSSPATVSITVPGPPEPAPVEPEPAPEPAPVEPEPAPEPDPVPAPDAPPG